MDPHQACTTTIGEVTLFSGTYSRLSNLYPVEIKIDDKTWYSVEQYYQHEKAIAAGKVEISKDIRATSDPVEAMELGRQVQPGPEWQDQGPIIMKKALKVKFEIPALKLTLRNTAKIIGEATRNNFWGIGLSKGDRSAGDPSSWTGKNLAGRCLMDIRKDILK